MPRMQRAARGPRAALIKRLLLAQHAALNGPFPRLMMDSFVKRTDLIGSISFLEMVEVRFFICFSVNRFVNC